MDILRWLGTELVDGLVWGIGIGMGWPIGEAALPWLTAKFRPTKPPKR